MEKGIHVKAAWRPAHKSYLLYRPRTFHGRADAAVEEGNCDPPEGKGTPGVLKWRVRRDVPALPIVRGAPVCPAM